MRRVSDTNGRVENTQGMPNKRTERQAFQFERISFQLCATLEEKKAALRAEAVSEKYAPFYEINSGHCGISEEHPHR